MLSSFSACGPVCNTGLLHKSIIWRLLRQSHKAALCHARLHLCGMALDCNPQDPISAPFQPREPALPCHILYAPHGVLNVQAMPYVKHSNIPPPLKVCSVTSKQGQPLTAKQNMFSGDMQHGNTRPAWMRSQIELAVSVRSSDSSAPQCWQKSKQQVGRGSPVLGAALGTRLSTG